MKTLLVCKSGSVFHTRDLCIERGEQGETEGIIRHLLDRGDCNVVYYGQYNGYDIPGLTVIQPNIQGLNEHSLNSEQREAFAVDLEQLKAVDPIAMINISGQAPTSSLGWNPMGAQCMAFSVRYNAPVLQALHELKLPRVFLNHDPRSYPRDQEMTWYSDYCRPVALLDQCEATVNRVVGGQKYLVHSSFGHCQSWAYQPETSENLGLKPAVIVAHAHFKTGIKKGDPGRWAGITGDYEVYGEGWEGHDVNWKGKLKPNEVLEQFRSAVCGPVVPHTTGFLTGKPYVMMTQGCIPIFHPSYDEGCRILPADHFCRLVGNEFAEKAQMLWFDEGLREEIREDMKRRLVPRWGVFDSLIDQLLVDPVSFMADKHWDRFGGYKRL